MAKGYGCDLCGKIINQKRTYMTNVRVIHRWYQWILPVRSKSHFHRECWTKIVDTANGVRKSTVGGITTTITSNGMF